MFKNYLKIKNWILKISAMSALVLVFSAPTLLFAQTDYVPLAPIPNTIDAGKTTTSLPTYLTGLYKTGIAAAGILAVLMLVWGGFQYMTTEAVSGKSESKGIIMNVVWGLATVLASYLLLYTINPRLVDIGLSLTNLNSVTKTKVPSAAESYGKFLDDALKRAQNISTKARDIKRDIETLEKKIEEGEYADADEGRRIIADIEKLKVKEVSVRKYENTDLLLTDAREQIRQCLNGLGACSVVKVNKSSAVGAFLTGGVFEPITGVPGLIEVSYDNTASKDTTKNNAAAQQIVLAARLEVNANKKMLEQNGLVEQAKALEAKMVDIENRTAFNIRCPNSKVTYVPGKGYESGPCP